MSVPYLVDIRRTTAPKRLHGQASMMTLKSIARFHMGAPIGERFKGGPETEPGGEFGFAPRAADYDARKERVKGHTDPLRGFTDQLRNQIRRMARITATQHRAVIRFRSPHPLKNQQWIEITYVPLSEARRYEKMANENYALFLNALQRQQAAQRKRIS